MKYNGKTKLFRTAESLHFKRIDSPTSERYVSERKKELSELKERNKSYDLAYFNSKEQFVT